MPLQSYEMKDSGVEWIGEIPKEWDYQCIKYLATCNDEVLSEDTPDDYVFDYIDIGSVHANKGIGECERMVFQNAPSRARRIVRAGDIIVSTVRTYLKAIAQVAEYEVPHIASTGFAVIRPKSINANFLKYALLSDNFVSQVEADSVGISYPAINASQLITFKIPVPPSPEQSSIASYLDEKCAAIDEIIAEAKATIDEYKSWKASVIFEAVTKGLNPNAEMKDSGVEWIGRIPKAWYSTRLKFLLKRPLQYGANSSGVEYNEKLPRYIRITDITKDNRLTDTDMLSLPMDEASDYILDDKDILLARSGATSGKAFLYRSKYGLSAFAGYLIRAKINNYKALPEYVYYSTLGSGYDQWKSSIALQATIPNIGANKYNEYTLPVPPLPEQQSIVTYLDEKCAAIDGVIAEKEALIGELESYKKSLIFETVTGKRRVAI